MSEPKLKVLINFLFLIILASGFLSSAQNTLIPSAKFSFDNRSDSDEVSGKKIRSMGTNFCDDRFGNANHAIYLYGNEYSYVNLGDYKALKPREGSISLWVKIEREVAAGQGYTVNPIILTKARKQDDFYEAYGIYYSYETKKINSSSAKDSLVQVGSYSKEAIQLYEWHHVVLCYDDAFFAMYLDGELQRKAVKNFETKFLDTDSVLLGISANAKNKRYMEGAIDDIYFYERVLNQDEITALYEAPNPNQARVILNRLLFVIVILMAITLLYFYIRWRLNIALKKERDRLEMNHLVLQTELRVNRALMNPHFLFNSMNSIQNLILNNKNDDANNYLIKFSKLIRKILESNTSESISLSMEIDILNRYFEIEELRFEEKFKYTIIVGDEINTSTVEIPIMMIQPFVENAIWHGLLNQMGDKLLDIHFNIQDNVYLICTIEDNGLGKIEKEKNTNDKKPLATVFVQNRLDLFNKIYNLNCGITITYKTNGSGTHVKLVLPILNRIKS